MPTLQLVVPQPRAPRPGRTLCELMTSTSTCSRVGSPDDLDGRLADSHLGSHVDAVFRERPCDLLQSAVRSLDEAAIETVEFPGCEARNPLNDVEQRHAACAVCRESEHHPEHTFVTTAQVDGNHEMPKERAAAGAVPTACRHSRLGLGTHDSGHQVDLANPHPSVARQLASNADASPSERRNSSQSASSFIGPCVLKQSMISPSVTSHQLRFMPSLLRLTAITLALFLQPRCRGGVIETRRETNELHGTRWAVKRRQ
jgi:hypothetical protein